MRLSKTLVDMDMADYSAALDPAYTTLEFENVQVLAMGNGRWGPACPGRGAGLRPWVSGWAEEGRQRPGRFHRAARVSPGEGGMPRYSDQRLSGPGADPQQK